MTHFNNAVRRIGWWQLCLCLSIFYTTSASAIRVPSATECLAVQERGGLCLAVPNGNTIAWCASQETLTNTAVAIANVLPATVAQNSTQNIIVTAPNAHFSSESKVKFSSDIKVNQVQVLSASQLQVNITVPPSIPLDMYDILIDTSGEISKGFCLLEVTASQSHAPSEILLSNQVIINDTATDSTVIGNFTTNDVDAEDAHVYRLLEDNSGYFAIDGNQLKVATPRFMIAGEYSIRVLATDNLGLALVKSFNVTVSGSRDEDAIPDAIEAKAPNDGDGNNDGKPDDQQSYVASLPLKNGQYLTLVSSNSSCPLQRVKIVTESELNADKNHDYPYDLVSFDYNCAVTSTIYSYYHGLTATGWSVRSYSSIAQQWNEMMQSTIEKVSLPGGQTLKVSAPLPGREDGQTRHIIVGLTSVKKAQIVFDSDKLTVDEFGEMTTINDKTGSFISIPVTRSNNSKGKVVVNYAIEAGTALANQDYYVANDKGTLTWEDGENFNQSISLIILDDTLAESPESFNVNLTGLSIEDDNVAELGTPKTITVTIRDNDGAQCQKNETLALQPSEKTVTLEMGNSPFTFSLSGGQGKIDIFTPPDGEIAKALLEAEGNQANVTLFPINVGETQLILEDCAGSQSRITISVKSQSTTTDTDGNVAQCLEDPTLALTPAFQEVTLVLGEAPITLTVSGGQKERTLSVAPDSTIVTASVPNFPEKAGASITFSGRKVGKTELVFSDCYSQASIKVNVVKQQCETTAERVLQPASQDITILLEQTDATTVLMTGGQGERWLSTAPDNEIVSAGNPIFAATGGGSITLMPKAVGQTKLVITDDCGDFAVAHVNVVSTHSLAHYCAMANEQQGVCESPDAQVQLPPLALEEDVFGTLFTTMANFHYRGIQENRVSSETLSALAVDMFVDPTHVGKAASLLLVARLLEGKYNQVYDGTNWRDLPKGEVAIEELPVFIEQPALPSALVLREQIIKPLTTLMNSSSGAEVFFGYRLKEKGIVVYNGMYPLLILSPNSSVMSATGVPQTSTTRIKLAPDLINSPEGFKASGIEPVSVNFSFYVDPKNVGQSADILLVVQHGMSQGTGQLYGYDGATRQWVQSPLETISKIAPESRVDRLPELLSGQVTISLPQVLSGQVPTGEQSVTAYMGYRLDNGDIIHISPSSAPYWSVNN